MWCYELPTASHQIAIMSDYFLFVIIHIDQWVQVHQSEPSTIKFPLSLLPSGFNSFRGILPRYTVSSGFAKWWHSNSDIHCAFVSWNSFTVNFPSSTILWFWGTVYIDKTEYLIIYLPVSEWIGSMTNILLLLLILTKQKNLTDFHLFCFNPVQ